MVAHSWGLSTNAWGPTWLKVRRQNGWRADEDETLMVGCGPDLELQKGTYMNTDAMTLALRRIILRGDPDCEAADHTTHSMKATMLSWCCKIGVKKEICRALGGHAKRDDAMPNLYGRDFLAEPLRQLGHALIWIAAKDFMPDDSRSGRWENPTATKTHSAAPGIGAATLLQLAPGTTSITTHTGLAMQGKDGARS